MAAVAIGSAVVGGIGSYLGGKAASKGGAHAANVQKWMYENAQEEMQPYQYAGNAALNQLYGLSGIDSGFATAPGATAASGLTPDQLRAKAMEAFYQSPEYTVQQGAAQQAFDRLGLARGDYASGNSALGSAEIAGRTFSDWRNNLAGLGAMGPQAAGMNTNLGIASGNAMAQNAMNQGQIQSDMYGAIGGTIQQGIGQYSQMQQYNAERDRLMMNANYGGTPPPVAPAPSSLDQLYQGGYVGQGGSMRVG